MNPVSDTAYLTCGARAADAASGRPVCGDNYAALFMTGHGKQVMENFRKETGPTASIVARHRIIDDLLRTRLASNGNTAIVLVGAGFDSRAYRLPGGQWVEIDEPQVITLKNQLLPVDRCRNPFQRIAIDFAGQTLASKLPTISHDTPVVVVMEGVFMYLDETQIHATLAALQTAYPGHTLICDMNTRRFMERYGKSLTKGINRLGAYFKFLPDDPAALFIKAGYREASRISTIAKTLEFARARFMGVMVALLFPVMLSDLSVHVFEAQSAV